MTGAWRKRTLTAQDMALMQSIWAKAKSDGKDGSDEEEGRVRSERKRDHATRSSKIRRPQFWPQRTMTYQKRKKLDTSGERFLTQNCNWSYTKGLSPSHRLCNFASRQVTPIYCQRRSWKCTAAHYPRCCSFVWGGDACVGVELYAAGQWHIIDALNSWTHIGRGFKRLSYRHGEVSHAVNPVLNLSWWWN